MNTYNTKLPGRIYNKRNRLPDGSFVNHKTWTVRYKKKDYATGTTDPKEAEKFLLTLMGNLAVGKPAPAKAWTQNRGAAEASNTATAVAASKETGVLMNRVFDDYVEEGYLQELASADGNKGIVNNHLRPFFGKIPASTLTSQMYKDYVQHRRTAVFTQKHHKKARKPTNACINRELASLKRALNLAAKETDPPLVQRFPKIKMLPESTPRQGFLSYPEYLRLKACLPDYLVPVLIIGYHTGNRRGELLQVELRDVEMDAETPQYRLYADATKSGEGRVVPIYSAIGDLFKELLAAPRPPGCTWLFHNNGEEILTFNKAWKTATKEAGLEGYLFHDLRRTAVRNLSRSKIPRKICMQITGHKTESVFERYNITDETDLRDAADKMDTYMATLIENAANAGGNGLIC